jgi:hypothetical protein
MRTYARQTIPPALLFSLALSAQVHLTPDGGTDTYALINKALGGTAEETPDCSHTDFGPHIAQKQDADLNRLVFLFFIHPHPDNDRCQGFDRQRTEIKTYGTSADYVKGYLNDSVSFRWKFKLDQKFQPSPNFTHIHQIKAGDGDDASPIITLTPRAGKPEIIEVIHVDSKHKTTKLASTTLDSFKGRWIEAFEQLTYGESGTYAITLTDVKSGQELLAFKAGKIDLWRDKTTFVRPKWGIYRSLLRPDYLRDEAVAFTDFCLAK